MPFDILQYPFVRGGLPTDIVFRCEPIDGNRCRHAFERCPFDRNLANGAGDDLDMDIPGFEDGKYLVQFLVSHQRFSSNDGYMKRLVLIDEANHAIHQRLTLKVADLPQYGIAAEMIRPVGITARATERTLFGNFDREDWWPAGKYRFPATEDFLHLHSQN